MHLIGPNCERLVPGNKQPTFALVTAKAVNISVRSTCGMELHLAWAWLPISCVSSPPDCTHRQQRNLRVKHGITESHLSAVAEVIHSPTSNRLG